MAKKRSRKTQRLNVISATRPIVAQQQAETWATAAVRKAKTHRSSQNIPQHRMQNLSTSELSRWFTNALKQPGQGNINAKDLIVAGTEAVKIEAYLRLVEQDFGQSVTWYRYSKWAVSQLNIQVAPGAAAYLQGCLHAWRQEFDDSRAAFMQAEKYFSIDSDFWFDRGQMESAAGRLHSAAIYLERARPLARVNSPMDGRVHRWLAQTYRWLGNTAREADVLTEILLGPILEKTALDEACQHLGRALLTLGQAADALEFADAWIEFNPGSLYEIARTKARALARLGQNTQAQDFALVMQEKLSRIALSQRRSGASQRDSALEDALRAPLILEAALRDAGRRFTADDLLARSIIGEEISSLVKGHDGQYRTNPEAVNRMANSVNTAIHYDRADLAERFGFELARLALDSGNPAILTGCLTSLNHIAADRTRLAHLHAEAALLFPEEADIRFQNGMFTRLHNPLEANTHFEAAQKAGKDLAKILLLLGANPATEDQISQIDTLLHQDWPKVSTMDLTEQIFEPAVLWAETNGYGATGARWVDLWDGRYAQDVQTGGKHDLYSAGGRCALLAGRYVEGTTFFRKAATDWQYTAFGEALVYPLREMARNNALTALAAHRANYVAEAAEHLAIAESQAPTLALVQAVSALINADTGNLDAAFETLMTMERDDLWPVVAQQVQAALVEQGKDNQALLLHRRLNVVTHKGPSHEEALELAEAASITARGEMERATQATVVALRLVEGLRDSQVLPRHHAIFHRITEALKDGKFEQLLPLADSVVLELSQQARAGGEKTRLFEDCLQQDWALLPAEMRDRLDNAQYLLGAARQHNLHDLGPALLCLATCVEQLSRQVLVSPLETAAHHHDVVLPWQGIATLGTAAHYLFRPSPPAYKVLLDNHLSVLSSQTRQYLKWGWRNDVSNLSKARNDWAHGSRIIQTTEFNQLITGIVGPRASTTVLGVLLELLAVRAGR